MKAIVCTAYGSPDVLKVADLPVPQPKAGEVRIRVTTSTVAAGDLRVRGFNSPIMLWLPMRLVLGLTRPRKPVLGIELAGVIEAVGPDVTRFAPGDRVFALTGLTFGAHAEFVCLSENAMIAKIPPGVSDEAAAALPVGANSALHFLRKGGIRSGQKVLIYGASGSVGTFAVQLAKHFGATVTAVCSTANQELVSALGADAVLDYTREDFSQQSERYDLVFDAVGKASKADCQRLLAPGGKYITVDGQGIAKESLENLEFLVDLLAKGQLKAVIDRRYRLEEVPEAHRYVETGRKRGAVIIQVASA